MKTKEVKCHCELHRKEPIPKIPKGFVTNEDIIDYGILYSAGKKITLNYLEQSIYDKRILLIEEVMSLSPYVLTLKYPDLWEDFKKYNYTKCELFHFVVIKKILDGDFDE